MAEEGAQGAAGAEGAAGAGSEGAGAAGGAGGQGGAEGAGAQGGAQFAIPEQYKGKGWASKVKSVDDLFSQIDTLDSLKGKKMIVPDFEKGDPAEVKAYLDTLRGGTKVEDYKFPEGTDKDMSAKVAQIFFDRGMPKVLGNQIIEAYAKLGQEAATKAFSKDGMLAVMTESFKGQDVTKAVGETTAFLKEHLSPEDQKFMENNVPNEMLGFIYRFANKIKAEYGATETGKGALGGKGASTGDKTAMRAELRQKIRDIDKRAHTFEEKQGLIEQLSATYK